MLHGSCGLSPAEISFKSRTDLQPHACWRQARAATRILPAPIPQNTVTPLHLKLFHQLQFKNKINPANIAKQLAVSAILLKIFALSVTFWQVVCCSAFANFCIFSYCWQIQRLGWISKENSRKSSATILVKNTPQRDREEEHTHVPGTRIRTMRFWPQGITVICRSVTLGAATCCAEGIKDGQRTH